jgi:hypothetical protein
VILEEYLRHVLAGLHDLDAIAAVPGLTYAQVEGFSRQYPTFRAVRHDCAATRDQFHAVRRLRECDRRAIAGSDKLMVFLMSGDNPAKYGRQVETHHTGSVEVRDGLSRLMEEIAVHGRYDPPADRPHTRPMRDLKTIEVAQSVDSQEDNDS